MTKMAGGFNRRNSMEDFRQQRAISELEKQVDGLHKEVHNLRQQQDNMLEQIRRLKEMNNDGSGK